MTAQQQEKTTPVRPLTEGTVRKGGRNHGPSQIKKRPAPPAPITPRKKAGTAVAIDDPAKRHVAPAQEPTSFLAVVMRAAADPKCDPAKMHALLDFQERLEAREAKRAFDDAFVALQAELPSIRRDGKIEIRKKDGAGERTGAVQQATPYATFNAIHEVIKPLLVKHDFGLSFSTEPTTDGRLIVRTTLSRKGHSITTVFPLPAETSGSKNNVQGWGSTQSYGKRYGTIALLNIVSHAMEDADTDGHQGNFKRAKEGFIDAPEETARVDRKGIEELRIAMSDAGVSEANFCAHYGIKAVAELPADLQKAAVKALLDHGAKKKAAPNG